MKEEPNLGQTLIAARDFKNASLGALDEASMSSDQLATAAQELAKVLRVSGSTASEPVILFISNRSKDIVGFLGIWLAGCVAVPVHVTTPEPTKKALIARTGARFAIRTRTLETVSDRVPPRRALLHGAAVIVFTSGSTGQPKGVVISHKGMIWKLDVLSRLIQLTSDDVVAVPLQLTFIFGIWVSLLSLMSGARLLLVSKLSGHALNPVTVIAAVPTTLRAITADASVDAPNLSKILTGGEPLGSSLTEKLAGVFPHASPYDLFGLTETGSCDFCSKPRDEPQTSGTIGRPTDGVLYRIAEKSELGFAPGIGELQVLTPAIMLGYLGDPAQTTDAFEDGYFRTGDLAKVRDDGCVQLVGRLKDVVSRGGNKIAPLEIENFFLGHEGVAAALAVGMPDERLGESLHLMIVRSDPSLVEATLRAWAKDRLERFKMPDAIHFVEALPAGRTGKVDRASARLLLARAAEAPDQNHGER